MNESNSEIISYISNYFKTYFEAPPTKIEFYERRDLICKGKIGKVWNANHKLTNGKVAIKTIQRHKLEKAGRRNSVLNEMLILKKIRHQRINRILEVFESDNHYNIVMEYSGGGNMLKFVKSFNKYC